MEGPICCNFACTGYSPRVPEPFRHRIRVRFNECDGQGVVFYANYLVYFDLAMTELWREAFGNGYAGMIERDRRDGCRGEHPLPASARFDDELDLVAQSLASAQPRRRG